MSSAVLLPTSTALEEGSWTASLQDSCWQQQMITWYQQSSSPITVMVGS
jgi:hypothetical protein